MSDPLAALPPQAGGLYADNSYKLVVSTVFSFVLASIGIIGRFAARYICKKRLELNDYFIVLAYIFKLGLTIISSLLVSYGIGKHVYVVSMDSLVRFAQATWTGSFIYAPLILFIKLSILSLYLNAFPSRFMKISVWILAGITAAWAFGLIMTGLLACLPIEKSWYPTIPGTCIDTYAYYVGLQIPNIVTDFAILFLPFKDIYQLNLPLNRLLQIGAVLALGLVTCILDIVRLVVFIDIPQGNIDVTWIYIPPAIWLDLEGSIAILVACLPVMRPLLHPKKFWYQSRVTYATNNTAGGAYEDEDNEDNEMHEYNHEKTVSAMAHERDGSSSSATGSHGMRNGEDFPQGNAV